MRSKVDTPSIGSEFKNGLIEYDWPGLSRSIRNFPVWLFDEMMRWDSGVSILTSIFWGTFPLLVKIEPAIFTEVITSGQWSVLSCNISSMIHESWLLLWSVTVIARGILADFPSGISPQSKYNPELLVWGIHLCAFPAWYSDSLLNTPFPLKKCDEWIMEDTGSSPQKVKSKLSFRVQLSALPLSKSLAQISTEPTPCINEIVNDERQYGTGFLQSLIVINWEQVLKLPHWSSTLQDILCFPNGRSPSKSFFTPVESILPSLNISSSNFQIKSDTAVQESLALWDTFTLPVRHLSSYEQTSVSLQTEVNSGLS